MTSSATSTFDIATKFHTDMPANFCATDAIEMSLSAPLHPAADEEEKSFRLLDLPSELVVRVLEFAVSIDHEQKLAHTPTPYFPLAGLYATSFKLYKQPAITRTCHWLRNEGLPIFYSCNRFLVTAADLDVAYLWAWIASLQAEHLKKMELYVMLTNDEGAPTSYQFDDLWSPSDFERDITKHSREQEYLEASEGYVRMADGKVKITFETCLGIAPNRCDQLFPRRYYQLSFADRSHEQEFWRNLKDFPDFGDEEAWERCFSIDWPA